MTVGLVTKVAVGLAVAALAGGCASSAEDTVASSAAPAGSVSASPAPSSIPELLATVEWPDDNTSLGATFDLMPDQLGGSAAVSRRPEPSPTGEQYDGYQVIYDDGDGASTVLFADPGSGIMNPAQGMAGMVVYSGGPQHCVDADYSASFEDLFQLTDHKELLAEYGRIGETQSQDPQPGELQWVVCTSTHDFDDANEITPRAKDEWVHMAGWGDGRWFYGVRAPSAQMRTEAVTALMEAIQEAQASEAVRAR